MYSGNHTPLFPINFSRYKRVQLEQVPKNVTPLKQTAEAFLGQTTWNYSSLRQLLQWFARSPRAMFGELVGSKGYSGGGERKIGCGSR